MACKKRAEGGQTCKDGKYELNKQCRVCLIVDKDGDFKPCMWCNLCKAWICQKDNNFTNPVTLTRRAYAALVSGLDL